jgi:hypothetical protein
MTHPDVSERLTFGPTDDGRKIAIISRGGHPQIAGSGTCEVLDVTTSCRTKKEAKAWFHRMLIERPWETRQ